MQLPLYVSAVAKSKLVWKKESRLRRLVGQVYSLVQRW
jgi:hypothetical protein